MVVYVQKYKAIFSPCWPSHPKKNKNVSQSPRLEFFSLFLTLRNLAIAIRIKGSKEILKGIIKEQGGSLVTECKPESHSYFLHCICPPNGLMHHHYELQQVNLSIVIHVNRSHQRINLCLSWIAAESSEESSQLFGTNITVLVLKGKTDYCSDQTNMWWREILCRINRKPLSSLRQNPGR